MPRAAQGTDCGGDVTTVFTRDELLTWITAYWVTGSIGTSTAFAAWNAAVYVAQIEDDRLTEMTESSRTLDATREVLRRHNGLWFYDESSVIPRRPD